jgi:hypothetical protein
VIDLARQLGAEAHRICAEADHFYNALSTRGKNPGGQSAA